MNQKLKFSKQSLAAFHNRENQNHLNVTTICLYVNRQITLKKTTQLAKEVDLLLRINISPISLYWVSFLRGFMDLEMIHSLMYKHAWPVDKVKMWETTELLEMTCETHRINHSLLSSSKLIFMFVLQREWTLTFPPGMHLPFHPKENYRSVEPTPERSM